MARTAHDLVVRGGLVADGRGGEPRPADLAVDGALITTVGSVPGRGGEEIDAAGLLVTPGFVDIHTHYDGQATWDERMTPSSWHGVTTAVMGNCGVGFAPVHADAHPRLISLMEGVEDIPGAVLDEGIDWSWESFGEYLDAVERRRHDIDLCAQLPHGALRLYVMGERAARLEEATPEDAAAMRTLATEAMRAGVVGFSTSRTLNHRTASGDPTPSLRASTAELEAIVLGVADAGHGVVELISISGLTPTASSNWCAPWWRAPACPSPSPLAQSHRHPEAWRDLLDRIEAAVADGLAIRAQVAPRPSACWSGCSPPTTRFWPSPPTSASPGSPWPSRRWRYRATRTAAPGCCATWPRAMPPMGGGGGRSTTATSTRWATCPTTSPRQRRACCGSPQHEASIRPSCSWSCWRRTTGATSSTARSPTMPTGTSTPAARCSPIPSPSSAWATAGPTWASFPTPASRRTCSPTGPAIAAHGRLPVGQVVQGLTSATATAVGLDDRGVVAEGMRADLTNDHRLRTPRVAVPVMAYDLPAGGKRLLQGAHWLPRHRRGRGDHLPGRGGHRCPPRAPGPGRPRHRPHPAGLVTNGRPASRRARHARRARRARLPARHARHARHGEEQT